MRYLIYSNVLLSFTFTFYLGLVRQGAIGNCFMSGQSKDKFYHDLDSLKWIIYSLNYKQKAIHYKFDSLNTSVVSLDVGLSQIDKDREDTVIYYFHFFRGKDKYNLPFYMNGIGFSKVSHERFLVLDCCFPRNVPGYKNGFERNISNSDRNFREFLSCYKGDLSPWLRAEAIRRKVIN